MTATYTPDSATYAWSQSDRQYGRSYVAPAARPGWYDGYSPMDRPNYMATPGPVVPSSNSTALRKGAMAAALLTAIVGGAVLGTFVLANSTSSPNPSCTWSRRPAGRPLHRCPWLLRRRPAVPPLSSCPAEL